MCIFEEEIINEENYVIYFCLFKPNGGIPQDNLVLIRMKPDENGRFGFNVKVTENLHCIQFLN